MNNKNKSNPQSQKTLGTKGIIVLLVQGLIGWALCGSIIGIGRNITTMENTLIIHAVGVALIFSMISWIYFRYFNFTTPLQTAAVFVIFAVLMDLFVIATFVEKSYAMFASVLGTWIPFALIFLSTYLVGWIVNRSNRKLLIA